jgi:hypothetical protein
MSDVFQAGNGVPANFSDGTLKVSFNGSEYNRRYPVGSNTLGQVVSSLMSLKGIKTASVYSAGRKLTTDDSAKPASSFSEIDIVVKDSRG